MNHIEGATCFGEVLVDRFSTQNPDGTTEVMDAFGGAPANTAMGLARLGIPVSFIGKVGADNIGVFLAATLKRYGVSTDGLIISPTEPTTVAFVTLSAEGDRSFTFQEGAHSTIRPDEVSLPLTTRMFHFGSLTQIHEPAVQTTEKLLAQAKAQGAIISYDPNIREALWGNLHHARDVILHTARRVDILKVNEEEAILLAKTETVEQAMEILFTPNLQLLLITLADRGCYFKTAEFAGSIPAPAVNVVDTTGAGDAFNAGVLSGLFLAEKPITELSIEELRGILHRAVVIGSLTTTKKGAITAFPTVQEIKSHLS